MLHSVWHHPQSYFLIQSFSLTHLLHDWQAWPFLAFVQLQLPSLLLLEQWFFRWLNGTISRLARATVLCMFADGVWLRFQRLPAVTVSCSLIWCLEGMLREMFASHCDLLAPNFGEMRRDGRHSRYFLSHFHWSSYLCGLHRCAKSGRWRWRGDAGGLLPLECGSNE